MLPVLTTSRLKIRPFMMDDLDALAGIHGDQQTMRFMGRGRTNSRLEVAQFLRRVPGQAANGLGEWGVERAADGVLIGRCGFKGCIVAGIPEIEMGYLIARPEWGKGYGTEVATALAEYGLNRLTLPRIIATIHPQNVASQRVIDKAGFAFERQIELPKGIRLIYAICPA